MSVAAIPSKDDFNIKFKVFESSTEIPKIEKRSRAIFEELGAPKMDYEMGAEVRRLEDLVKQPCGISCVSALMMTAFIASAIIVGVATQTYIIPLIVYGIAYAISLAMSMTEADCEKMGVGEKLASVLTLGYALPFINVKHRTDPESYNKEQEQVLERMDKVAQDLEKSYPDLKKKLEERIESSEGYTKESAERALAELDKFNTYYKQFRSKQ